MADRPRNDDWWLASDGKWYPPELHPAAEHPSGGVSPTGDQTAISAGLTNAVSILVGVASALLVMAAFFGFRFADELRELGDTATDLTRDPTASEFAYAGWFLLAGVMLAIAAVTTVVWVFTTSRAGDQRGATGRTWRGGWTVGSWVIPIANLVLPKLVFNELEKIFQVPYRGLPIEEEWRGYDRTALADLWWALWVAGSVVSLGGVFLSPGDADSGETLASGVTLTAFTMLLTAASGVFFILVVRRIRVFSTR
ncbi:MAG: DUF4328 domain-containing protein [Acidimicrobiia bacterium]|nr:DUF4328 domain-containing protein [Acidimicrobiia bacterium]